MSQIPVPAASPQAFVIGQMVRLSKAMTKSRVPVYGEIIALDGEEAVLFLSYRFPRTRVPLAMLSPA